MGGVNKAVTDKAAVQFLRKNSDRMKLSAKSCFYFCMRKIEGVHQAKRCDLNNRDEDTNSSNSEYNSCF